MMEDHCSKLSKLTYIRADGDNDTVHFMLDAMLKPSLVVVITNKDAIIQVNYTAERANDIKFTEPPKYMFASVFNNVSLYFKLNYSLQ